MKRSSNFRSRYPVHGGYEQRQNAGVSQNVSSVQTKESENERLVYLDNAATSFPRPSEVAKEVARAVEEYGGNPGRGSHLLSRLASEKINEARELGAQIFGSSKPENVIFTHNATEALNMAIFSATKDGGHVLISDIEHNSVYRPISHLADIGKITFDIYSSVGKPEDILQNLSDKIKKDTVLVVACHRSNISPVELPIEAMGKLCTERGIKFVIDASQSAGSCDISIKRSAAWAICAPGHKGLYGPQGSGLLVLGENVRASDITPFYFGGSGPGSSERNMPDTLPYRMEAGTLPTPAIAGLCEGMKYVIERGAEEIGRYESALLVQAKNTLSALPRVKIYLPSDNFGSIMLFNIEGVHCKDVAEYLDRYKICVRSGLHCAPLAHRRVGSYQSGGGVRVSFGAFSQKEDIERLYRAVRSIVVR